MAKRLRIIAGPNGSGKSSVYADLLKTKTFHWGVFVNADEIEKQLREKKFLNVTTYGIDNLNWDDFLSEYVPFVEQKNGICKADNLLYRDHSIIVIDGEKVDSYLACHVADFIRRKLLDKKGNVTFTIETVMSHDSKLNLMRAAKEKGFKVYLYYVSTSSPEINVGRVATRVQEGGHDVPLDKIRSRYYRSLKQLRDAILLSDRAYIFDNSENKYQWVAEYDAESGQMIYKSDEVPSWVIEYVNKPKLSKL